MIKKITRFTGIIAASIIIFIMIIAVSISLLYYFYPEESVKQIIKNRAEILLDRKIEIGSLHYSPKGIVIYNATIYDKSLDNSEQVLVKADEAVITFSLFSIIKKDFKLRTIYFNGLELNCIFNQDGSSNIKRIFSELKEKAGSGRGDKSIQLSKIILNDCRIKIINPPERFKPLEGEYRINTTIRIKNNKTFTVSDSRVSLPLSRGYLYPELVIETSGGLIATGRIKLEDASIPWVYKFSKNNIQLPFETVNGQINDFEFTLSQIKGNIKANSTLSTTKSMVTADGECIVDIPNRTALLNNIKGKINSSSANIDNMLISVKKGQSGIKKFGFSNISCQLGDLRYILKLVPPALSGSVKGVLSYNGTSYSGKIDVSDISYKSRTELFRDLNTTFEINNNTVKKENIPVTILGSSSTASIATTDNKFKSFYISIKSDRLDVNNIHFRDSNSSENISSGQVQNETVTAGKSKPVVPISVSGIVNIKELIYDDFIFKNTKANISVSNKIIKINNADTSILSGALSGIGTVDISKSSPSVQTSLRFNNIKIQDIKFKNEKLNGRLFGFAEGTANISLIIKEKAAETIKGNATFTVTKGKVVNTGVQDGLIVFLSELRYKLKDLEFNKIYGNIDVSGNSFNINSFIFNSEDIRLSMTGHIDRDLTADDMKMKLEFNNHFIKDIPGGSFLLTLSEYASGKWYVIPFLLNGSITDSKNMKMLKKDQ